jgi:DNA-binding transcriptional MerR regulator
MSTNAFDLSEMARIVGMSATKAKNWTSGRPFKLAASIMQASGRGKSNIYSLNDLYLMAVAEEFSRAGLAAKAIGRLLEALQKGFPNGIAEVSKLTVWREQHESQGQRLKFHVLSDRDRPGSKSAQVWHQLDVKGLVKRLEKAIELVREGKV